MPPGHGINFSMAGKIRRNRQNWYIDLHWRGERIRIFSDREGNPLYSRRQAERLLERIRSEIDYGDFDPKNYIKRELKALRFDNYAEAWLARQQHRAELGQISLSHLKSTVVWLRRYILRAPFRSRSVKDIREGHIEDFLLSLPGHLSPKTQQNILGVLHKILADAHRRRDIGRVPVFPRIEMAEPEIKWLYPEEQAAVLSHIRCPVIRAFFVFCMNTGVRQGEARALRWERVDFQERAVTVAASMDGEVYRNWTKERNIRRLPLNREALAALRSLPRHLSGFVFARPDGRPLTANQVRGAWARAARKAGLAVSAYQGTRHSLACRLVNEGVPLNLIQDVLGHKTPEMVRRYAKVKLETLRRILETSADRQQRHNPQR